MNKSISHIYIGDLWYGSTSLDRMLCMKDFGLDVKPFDITPFRRSGSRISRSIRHRLKIGKIISDLNHRIVEFSASVKPPFAVWIDKGPWIWPGTLGKLREAGGQFLIHTTPDAAILANNSRYFKLCIPLYDAIVTTKTFERHLYLKAGAKSVFISHQSYNENRFYPRSEECKYKSDIIFIGRREPHYCSKLKQVASLKLNLRISGPNWFQSYHPHKFFNAHWSTPYVIPGGIWGDEYPKALSSAKICLGLLSKLIPETTTTRTFEIPACGAFLLAERTLEHEALFEEGKEAEFFGSDDELIDKIRFYIAHDSIRRSIAAAGRKRCELSGYGLRSRFEDLWSRLVGGNEA